MKMIIYTSNFVGKENCCVYPNRKIIESAEDLKQAAAFDHVCGAFKNNYRSVANFIESSTVVMDCDNDGENFITPEKFCEILPDVSFAIVPSRNNNKPKGNKPARPRFHVYFPTEKISDAEIYANLKSDIYKKFPFFDENALDAARFIFGNSVEKIIWHEGEITIDCLFSRRTIPEGQRNNTLSRFAGRVVKRYGATDKAYEIFLTEAEKCEPPLDDSELQKIWQSACKFAEKIQTQKDYVAPEIYNADFSPLKPPDYSDIGQAKALVAEYGDELKYTSATDYIRYDGKVWIESRQQAVGAMEEFLDLQLAESKAELNKVFKELEESGISAEIIKNGGKNLQKNISTPTQSKIFENYLSAVAYKNFVMKRRDMKFVISALQAAKPMLEISPSDLDKENFLLNCPDGTYDLNFGMNGRREHRAEDFITKITAVSPSDKGKELWLAAVEKFFCGDKNLIEYVQKIASLGLIGRVDLEALIIAYGDGRNGKSTFWNVIQKVLNNYGGGISADALTVGCKRNVKPELAETKGKRLLIAAELEEGMRLSTSIVKQLCSTDIIKGEKKYKDPFDFVPSHILVLYTNHLPRVGAMDEGIWRRLIVIPFNARIEGDDDIKNYADYLFKNAGEYVLKWLIEGAEKSINEGFKFKKPDCVEKAIGKYRADNDWMSHFLDECCELDKSFTEKSGKLYTEYRAYCMRTGGFARSTTEFYTALEQRGFQKVKVSQGRIIRGLCLVVDDFEN